MTHSEESPVLGATFDQGRLPTVTLVMSPDQAQAVFDKIYVYETGDGALDRSVVARWLLDSGAVTPAALDE